MFLTFFKIVQLIQNRATHSYVLLGKTLLVEKPIPASYIQVEKAVAAIAENLQNEMPVLEEPQFR